MPVSRANPGFGVQFLMGDGGVGAGTQASRTIGLVNQQIVFFAKVAGTLGNNKTVTINIAGLNTAFALSVTENAIVVTGATDGGGLSTTTVNELLYQLMQNDTFAEFWEATRGVGDGTGVIVAAALGNLAGGTNGAEVFTEIAEITDLPGFGTTHRTDEVTHMSSPNGWVEHIGLGIKEGKAFTLAMNFVGDDADQIELFQTRVESGNRHNYRIQFTDDDLTQVTFAAIISDSDISHPRDAKADLAIQVLPSGGYTWGVGA